jgi:hypothetical protein
MLKAHMICEITRDESFQMPETKEEGTPHVISMEILVQEEFPTSLIIIGREQETNKNLINATRRSKQFKHVTMEGSKLAAHE